MYTAPLTVGEDVFVASTEHDHAPEAVGPGSVVGRPVDERTRRGSARAAAPAIGQPSRSRLRWLVSALVVVGLVGAIVLVTPRTNDAIRAVDYADELAAARATAPYNILVPVGLGPGWTPTSAKFTTYRGASRWHLGYIAPTGDTVGLEQSDGDHDEFIDLLTGNGRPDGVLRVGTLYWSKHYSHGRDLRALVLERADAVVVVAGMASYETLAELALALDVR